MDQPLLVISDFILNLTIMTYNLPLETLTHTTTTPSDCELSPIHFSLHFLVEWFSLLQQSPSKYSLMMWVLGAMKQHLHIGCCRALEQWSSMRYCRAPMWCPDWEFTSKGRVFRPFLFWHLMIDFLRVIIKTYSCISCFFKCSKSSARLISFNQSLVALLPFGSSPLGAA